MQTKPDILLLSMGLVLLLGLFLMFGVMVLLLRPWLRAFLSGGRVSIMQIIGMRLRGNPVGLILDAYLALLHSGKEYKLSQVESCYVANRHKILDSGQLVALVPASTASQDP